MELKNKALVIQSGGMDSNICLAHAIDKLGKENVYTLSFDYGQRHFNELAIAKNIARDWGVHHLEIPLKFMDKLTQNSLIDHRMEIEHQSGQAPNSLVMGRNGLMARLGAVYAESLGIKQILMGVIEVESANSGYRDCTREYMDLMQKILCIDLGHQNFEIITPIIAMTKSQTMQMAYELGVLEYLLENTISCYEGIQKLGCGKCPACKLRNEGIQEFLEQMPTFTFSYRSEFN
jgi:7-cyano-7-deazaguanine synthase